MFPNPQRQPHSVGKDSVPFADQQLCGGARHWRAEARLPTTDDDNLREVQEGDEYSEYD